MRECPMTKAENKEHYRHEGKRDKRRDLVLDKNARKAAADHFMKKALDHVIAFEAFMGFKLF